MGRHRHKAHYNKQNKGLGVSIEIEQIIEDRLGYNGLICERCNARNPQDSTKCRKCGYNQLREKADDFRND